MKRMSPWLLSLVLLAGLTMSGCGQSEEPPSTLPSAPQSESKAIPTPAATPVKSSAEVVAVRKEALPTNLCRVPWHGRSGHAQSWEGHDQEHVH